MKRLAVVFVLGFLLSPNYLAYPAETSQSKKDGKAPQKDEWPASGKTEANRRYDVADNPEPVGSRISGAVERIARYCDADRQDEPKDWLHRFLCDIRSTDVFTALFTGALVLVTIALIVVGACQYWLSRKTARQQLRAYVIVKEVSVELVRDQNTNRIIRLTCRIAFFNAGQTPAYELEYSRGDRLTEWVPDPAPITTAGGRFPTMSILGPRVEHPDDIGTGIGLEPAQVDALQRGQLGIRTWGEVRYRDIFGKTQRTWFSHQWPAIITKIEDPRSTACRRGNGGT